MVQHHCGLPLQKDILACPVADSGWADTDKAQKDGFNHYWLHLLFGNFEVCCLIAAGAEKEKSQKDGITALGMAAARGHLGIVAVCVRPILTPSMLRMMDKHHWWLQRGGSSGHCPLAGWAQCAESEPWRCSIRCRRCISARPFGGYLLLGQLLGNHGLMLRSAAIWQGEQLQGKIWVATNFGWCFEGLFLSCWLEAD